MKLIKDKIGGFTLIELLIVMMIIVLMAGFSIGYLNGTQASQKFENQFDVVLSLIRRARNNAVFARPVRVDFGDGDGEVEVVPANYGITVEVDKLVYFADFESREVEGDLVGELLKDNTDLTLNNGGDLVMAVEKIEGEYELEMGMEDNPAMNLPLSFYYSAFDAWFEFDGYGNNVESDLVIQLKEKNGDRCKAVGINLLIPNPEIRKCL